MTAQLDAARVKEEFRRAVVILRDHGLKQSAKFCAEQLVGLAEGNVSVHGATLLVNTPGAFADDAGAMPMEIESPSSSTILSELEGEARSDRFALASTYFEVGEYLRSAAALTKVDDSGGPLPAEAPAWDAPSREVFLWAYALFLAGEKRKEEDVNETRKEVSVRTVTQNIWLEDLRDHLVERQRRGLLRGLCPYMLGVLYKEISISRNAGGFESSPNAGVIAVCPPRSSLTAYENAMMDGDDAPTWPPKEDPRDLEAREAADLARSTLASSARQFPWNWSAFLDLSDLSTPSAGRRDEDIQKILQTPVMPFPSKEELLKRTVSSVYYGPRRVRLGSAELVAACHGAKEAVEIQKTQAALRILAELKLLLPRSPFVVAQEALTFYASRDFDGARRTFERLRTLDPFRLDHLDVYSNVLYVKDDKAELSKLAHSAHRVEKYRPETCCVVGNYYSLKRQHERAILYFQRALRLDRACLSAWTLMGHEYIELKNTHAAVEAYRRAVDTNSRDYRAWYGLGQTYEMLTMYFYALFYYRQAAKLRPYDGRMWIAVAHCHENIQHFDDAIKYYERAAQVDDADGHAHFKLAKLYRARDQRHKAATFYQRYVDIVHGADADELAERTGSSTAGLPTDVDLTESSAEALLFLAETAKEHHDYDDALLLLERLLDYAGPEKQQAQSLLRDIRKIIDDPNYKAANSSGANIDID
eukprot:CAMPEP_0118902052 /NCGR_PEP_ID=MMETSP1166-20130328/7506_1 /TAXON_ID=1104430 /ORGANISM="Chrysoreinhardia sp, Strain CCMP3193" /LENGTH=703 /DNA_ID=CAMNT_0006841247 /DNA_START=37 /DNA_END=2148 /DNA_ORIENTATION=+